MFGGTVSHEWDTLAFALSTIPAIATFLFIVGAYWEQWRRRPLPARNVTRITYARRSRSIDVNRGKAA
jgi:hypothetical protein